jgi:hypothetical protein
MSSLPAAKLTTAGQASRSPCQIATAMRTAKRASRQALAVQNLAYTRTPSTWSAQDFRG